MEDILEQLYMGEINPCTTCYHNTPELKDAFSVVDKAEKKIKPVAERRGKDPVFKLC